MSLALFFFYCNNTKLVDPKIRAFYNDLKDSLKSNGYSVRLVVISTKRAKWHNDLNGDGKSNNIDVDIAFNILDKFIVKDKGGVGTYKGENSFVNRQMIHIDCRGYKSRWAR